MKNNLLKILPFLFLISCKGESEKEVKPLRKDIAEIVFASGSLESDNKYNLTAQTDGNIIKLNLVEGASVSVNQEVAVIDNKQNIISTNSAAEQLKIAQYNTTDNAPVLQQIKANMKRLKKNLARILFRKNAIRNYSTKAVLPKQNSKKCS